MAAEGSLAEDVAAAAEKKNVEVIPLQRYAFGRVRRNGIVLGFAAVEPRELRRWGRGAGLSAAGLMVYLEF